MVTCGRLSRCGSVTPSSAFSLVAGGQFHRTAPTRFVQTLRVPDAATEARELVRIVSSDTGLPHAVRNRAADLTIVAEVNPDIALTRLAEVHRDVAPALPRVEPTVDYVRCLSIEVFWRFNLEPGRKAYFATAEDYRRAVEADPDPAERLLADLGPDPLVPAANSWLVPKADVAGFTGPQIKSRLNMSQAPPYVLFVCSVARMIDAGVTVRVPRGVDAIPSGLLQWYPENVPHETIDGDLPRKALERIEWRP